MLLRESLDPYPVSVTLLHRQQQMRVAIGMEELLAEIEVQRRDPGPARGGCGHAAGPLDDLRMVGPNRGDDRELVLPSVGLKGEPSFVGGDPADQINALLLQFPPQIRPVQIEANRESHPAEIGVEHLDFRARYHAVVDFVLGRMDLRIGADEFAGAVEERGDVRNRTPFQNVEPCHNVHAMPPRAVGDRSDPGPERGSARERSLAVGMPGQHEPFRQTREVGALRASRLQNRQAEPQVVVGVGGALVEGRGGRFERRHRGRGDAHDLRHAIPLAHRRDPLAHAGRFMPPPDLARGAPTGCARMRQWRRRR